VVSAEDAQAGMCENEAGVMISIKVTLPENVSRIDQVMRNIRQVVRSKTAPELKSLFDGTTSGWKDRPSFPPEYIDEATRVGVFVGPDSVHEGVYTMVSEGVGPHTIAPRRAPYMTLQRYRAATRPGSLSSRSAARIGGVHRAFYPVTHPGVEPRKFPEQIADKYEPTFRLDVQDAINSAEKR